jgi:hypothetical protein
MEQSNDNSINNINIRGIPITDSGSQFPFDAFVSNSFTISYGGAVSFLNLSRCPRRDIDSIVGANLDKNSVPVIPHIAAKIRVHMGVPMPNPKPKNPTSICMGKTIRTLDSHGSMLRTAPFLMGAF